MRICASGAEIGTETVSTGRTRPSQGPGWITGMRRRRNDTTWISTTPSQKVGSDTSSDGMACEAGAEPAEGREARGSRQNERDQGGEREAEAGQPQRRRKGGAELVGDRHPGLDGMAEVARQRVAQRLGVLHQQGLSAP